MVANNLNVFNEASITGQLMYKPLFNLLMLFYAFSPVRDLGIAIILLTAVIRLILGPSFMSSIRTSLKMKELQPKIDALKEQHKDDQKKHSEELMKIYKEHRVNPLGSCLASVIQLPILFVLYRVFYVGLNDASLTHLYSWFPAKIEHLNTIFLSFLPWSFIHIDLTKPSWILAVLAGLAQFWQMQMSSKLNPIPADGKGGNFMLTQMNYIFPAMTLIIGLTLPAALSLYWLVTTVFTALQQWYTIKTYKKTIIDG